LQLPVTSIATPSMFECLLCVMHEAHCCLSGTMAAQTFINTISTLSTCQFCIHIKGCCHNTWTASCLQDCMITAAQQRNAYWCMRMHGRGPLASRPSCAWGFEAQAQNLAPLAEALSHGASKGCLWEPSWYLMGQRPWVQPWT